MLPRGGFDAEPRIRHAACHSCRDGGVRELLALISPDFRRPEAGCVQQAVEGQPSAGFRLSVNEAGAPCSEIGKRQQPLRIAPRNDQPLAAVDKAHETQPSRAQERAVGLERRAAGGRVRHVEAGDVAFSAREAREALQAAAKVQLHFGSA
jgi:hypothetical protein